MNISIIIPNYNGAELLRKNLPKVLAAVRNYTDMKAVEIIVVDDGSTDESIEVINGLQNQNLKLIRHNKNFGFSTTVNDGVRKATGEILVLLNTDVIPEENFLKKIVAHFKNENVFAVGFMDKSIENDTVVLRGRGIGKWDRGLLMHQKGDVNKTNTLWVNGGSGAFRSDIWNKLKGFNSLYNPFYWEDIDLSYRALKQGYNLVFDKEIIVTHEHESGSIKSNYSSFEYRKIAHRNALIFVWLNITDFGLMLSHIFWLPYHLVNTLIKEDTAFINGLIEALIKLPVILKSRRKINQNTKISDRVILKDFST